MKLGIVGLPNVGKSTLFNAITNAHAEAQNYPFCTIEPNVGVVQVPDERLYKLAALYDSKKIVHTSIEFVDIAGLVKGASKGEGLGNKFLSHIREVDAIVEVVRCFDNPDIIHVEGSVDPLRDIETVNVELALADLDAVSRRLEKVKSSSKSGEKRYFTEIEILSKIYSALSEGRAARSVPLTKEEEEYADSLFLLTKKKIIYVANIAEGDYLSRYAAAVKTSRIERGARRSCSLRG